MGELNRSEAIELFTGDVLESTPCIIIYSSQNFEYSKQKLKSTTQSAREIFDNVLGEHECTFIYKGKDNKDNRSYLVIVEDLKISLRLSVRSNKSEFQLTYISDEESVVPADPTEYRKANLRILAEEYVNHNSMDFLDENDLMTSYREIKGFIKSLETLQEPVREINLEQSRKMWQAYIDGENALNTDKKNLFIVSEVGKVAKEYVNNRPISTVTIKVEAPTLQEQFTEAIQDIPALKFKDPKVNFKTSNSGEITIDEYLDVSDELLDQISTTAADNSFRVSDEVHHILSGTLHLQTNENLETQLVNVNQALEEFDAKYEFDSETNTYMFTDDLEVKYLVSKIEQDFEKSLSATPNTKLTCKFISRDDVSKIKEDILQLPGVIDVQDSVNGQLLIKTDGKQVLDTSNDAFKCIKIVAYRALYSPRSITNEIEIPGLKRQGNSYVYMSNDYHEFRKQSFNLHKQVIDAYESKQFIQKELDYGCVLIPDKKRLREMQLQFVGNNQIKVKAALGNVDFYPKDLSDYQLLIDKVKELCDENLDIVEETYRPSVIVRLLSEDVSYCKGIYKDILETLTPENFSFSLKAQDESTYRDLDYYVELEDIEHLEKFNELIDGLLLKYPTLLTNQFDNDSENGTTMFPFVFDRALNIRFEKKISSGFIGEDINLVKADEYDAISEKLDLAYEEDYHDYAEIKDLKRSRNQMLRDALKLGKCKSRKLDSIKFEIGPEFIDFMEENSAQLKVSNFIHVGDYLQFPMIGKSSELRRLSDSMLRISRPGELYPKQKIRRIPAPANPRLSDFLFDPRYAGEFEEDLEEVKKRISENKIEKFLNEKQLEAVAKAVAAPDIAIIQGPPGTGKTTVIAEIIYQQILKKPDSKILLTSQTNLAVDNALERLKGTKGIRPVRIQNTSNENKELGMVAKRYMLDYMEDWCIQPDSSNVDNGVSLWLDTILKKMDDNEKYSSILQQWKQDLQERDQNTREQFFEAYKNNVNLVAATCSICGSKLLQDVYALLYGNTENAFDIVIMDEASKATPLEMSVPMVWGKKIIIIGDHKQLPPMMNEDNIIISLKKAGKPELAEAIDGFKESQFEILFRSAFKLKPSIVATLDTQYRMHKKIMNTVGHFYSEELEDGLICGLNDSDMDNPDYNARGSRYHGIKIPGYIEPDTHAVWINVDSQESQPNGSTSYVNEGELKAVQTVLKALQKAEGFKEFMDSQQAPEDKEIGVITFYGAQFGKLKEMYKKGELGKDLSYPINIDVVDKFQGMERNIVIISTVRNNKIGKYGFAEDIRRINVGFSRARRLLIVVGNRKFFKNNPHYSKSIDEMEHFDIKQLQDMVR